jgi:hypothetical protein
MFCRPFTALLTFIALPMANLALADQTYTNILIPANSEISGAGNAGLPDGAGVAPILLNLPSNPSILTMSSVTGAITLNSGGGQNNPDGVVFSGSYGLSIPGASQMNAFGGLSGIEGPGAGYLVGVFETSSAPSGAPPASLDFVTFGTNFANLSPALNQVFYIGDGLTGDGSGSVQQFNVPAGATRLFLGISDAPFFVGGPGAYGDNSGNFTATLLVVPEPTTMGLIVSGAVTLLGLALRKSPIF